MIVKAFFSPIKNDTIKFDKKNIKVTISAGICKWNKELNTMNNMIEESDKQLYYAKSAGRNRIYVSE